LYGGFLEDQFDVKLTFSSLLVFFEVCFYRSLIHPYPKFNHLRRSFRVHEKFDLPILPAHFSFGIKTNQRRSKIKTLKKPNQIHSQ
jgi:hypothetical protein